MDSLARGFLCSLGVGCELIKPKIITWYDIFTDLRFLFSFFGFLTVLSVCWYVDDQRKKVLRGGRSWLFKAAIDQTPCRTAFRSAMSKAASQPVKFTLQPAQPHPKLAALRTLAGRIMLNICSDVGLIPYYVQHSTGSMKSGASGSFTIRIDKDAKLPQRKDVLRPNSCLISIDDDYWMDMNEELPSTWPCPWLSYTVQPRRAAGTVDGGSYFFDDDSYFNFTAAAGGTYRHPMWDWSNDHVTVVSNGARYIYAVDRYFMPENKTHAIIALLPVAKVDVWFTINFTSPFEIKLTLPYYLADWSRWEKRPVLQEADHLMPASETLLRRFDPVIKGTKANYAVYRVQSKSGDSKITIARTGIAGSIRITENKYAMVMNIVAAASSVPTASSFHSIGLCLEDAMVVNAHVRNTEFKPLPLIPVRPITVYTKEANIGSEPIPTMRDLCTPIISGVTFCPTNDQTSMVQAVETRLMKFDTEREMNSHLRTEFDRFLTLIAAEAGVERGTLIPMTEDDFLARLTGSKLDRNVRAFNLEAPDVATSFVKAETYQEPKDPRPILNYSTTHNGQLGRFSTSLAMRILKKLSWYGFCDPATLGDRLVRTACVAESYGMDLYEADGHRFDGHVNELQRIFERKFFLFFLDPQYHSTFIALHDDDREIKVRGSFGFTWDLQNQRGSGSALTSDCNSIISAFMSYYRFRLGRKVLDPETAYKLIGVIGGDDTVVPSDKYFAENYVKAADKIGHQMEIKKCEFDRVPAFGRMYFGLKFGSKNSCSIPARVFAKFHATSGPILNDQERKLRIEQKALSLWYTDRNTPVLGEICKFILKNSRYQDVLVMEEEKVGKALKDVFAGKTDLSNGIYFAVHDEATLFENERTPEMDEFWNLECYSFEMERFRNTLATAKTTEEFLNAGPYGRVQEKEQLALDKTLDVIHQDHVVPKTKIKHKGRKRNPIVAEKLAEEMEAVAANTAPRAAQEKKARVQFAVDPNKVPPSFKKDKEDKET